MNSPTTRNVPSRDAGDASHARSARCKPFLGAHPAANSTVSPPARPAALWGITRLLVESVLEPHQLLFGELPDRGTSASRTRTGRGGSRRGVLLLLVTQNLLVVRVLVALRHRDAEPLALVLHDRVAECRVCIASLEDGWDAELTSGLQRPRRPERKCTMSISPASSESPGYYRVVERARPPPPEHPIRNPSPYRGRGSDGMVVGSGRWSTPGAP